MHRAGQAIAAGALAMLAGPAMAVDLPAGTDPVFAEVFKACVAAIDGGGFLDESMGWISHESGDPDAVASDNWGHGFATKDVPGVGGLNLSATVELYPGYELGHCNVSTIDLMAEIVGPALKSNGFPGSLQGDDGDWWGV